MKPSDPFDEEHDPELHVTLSEDQVEVRGVQRLDSLADFKEKLNQLSPDQLMELLHHLKPPPSQ